VTLLATCLVGNATASWHTYLIFPSAFLSIIFWLERVLNILSRFRVLLVSILAIFFVTFSILLNFVFLTPAKSKINPLLSETSLNKVADGIDHFHFNHDGAVLFVNWGEYNRYVLQNTRIPIELGSVWDAWPWFNEGNTEETKRLLKWATDEGPFATYKKILFVQNNYRTPGLRGDIDKSLDLSGWYISKTYSYKSEEGNQIIFTLWVRNQ
jgi:hypothetical protein